MHGGGANKQLAKRAEPKITWRSKNSKKSWTVPQVTRGDGIEVGPPEMPAVHQPSTFSRKKLVSKYIYITMYNVSALVTRNAKSTRLQARQTKEGSVYRSAMLFARDNSPKSIPGT